MNKPRKTIRPYRLVTPETVATHLANRAVYGNGSKAVRETSPEYDAPEKRAEYILKKSHNGDTANYIDVKLQEIGKSAIDRLDQLVQSPDEQIATRNVHYAIDHIRGKAVQKSESKNLNISIESVLE